MQRAQVNVSFIIRALRNCGYNNYTSIFEFIDNAIERYVKATKVKLGFETQGSGMKKKIRTIVISDNGIGMTLDCLQEAMTLGSETGKLASSDLGYYGAGMKTAALSIGRCLSVYTIPQCDDSALLTACMRITDDNKDIVVEYVNYDKGSEVYNEFVRTIGGNHGTVVKVSELDKMSTLDYNYFRGAVYKKIAETYNKFIEAGNVELYVENDKVSYLELMGKKDDSIIVGEGDFTVDGHVIRYRARHLTNMSSPWGSGKKSQDDYNERSITNQGFYIYRNNRLVGKGLTLGLWVRHSIMNGFRCEIFVDGECDYLFGSTFNKMVTEKNRDSFSQSFMDKLSTIVVPLGLESRRKTAEAYKHKMIEDPEEERRSKEVYQKAVDEQNSNKLIHARRYGVNSISDDSYIPEKKRGPQKNPNPTKIRVEKWLNRIEEISDGRCGLMFQVIPDERGVSVQINRDHAFYQEFFALLPENLKYVAAKIIASEAAVKTKMGFFDDENYERYYPLMEFEEMRSRTVNASLGVPCPTSVMKYAEEQEEKRDEIEETDEKKVRRQRKSKTEKSE